MTDMRRKGLILGLLAVLTGCASGTEEAPLQVEIAKNARDIIKARRAGPAELPPVTRAELDALTAPALEARVERLDMAAYLYVSAERDEGAAGHVQVWRTGDNVSLTMRNGVLVATRGIGGDILSSAVQVSGSLPGPSEGGPQVQMIRTGDIEERRMTLACELAERGPAQIEIVGRRHATRLVEQHCVGDTGEITNSYWIDTGAGVVWQSRQWAGPEIGYMRFRLLRK
ncbi:YjbF family lipoprotein [Ruegeria pomeroyi]|uniref:YjbF family lipoprotein n=1 Tax=Ruegeria pomeroyi TaxID=89184 RepID=UPI001F1F0A19|nr:YjbF family lipoprotein [Ruegeria pomeroyi]MCE8510021.1 YjbF family lipoprotein [Ruegeria pomeroyi]